MAGYICPFCNQSMSVFNGTHYSEYIDFGGRYKSYPVMEEYPYLIAVDIFRCPNCKEDSIVVNGIGEKIEGIKRWIYPRSIAKVYPDYVPEQIRNDYEEAASIVDLSPKASATLSRRCLQGMIRDFWGIKDKGTLYQEIEAISDKVSPATKRALNDTRQIGNIGAHMEQDIDKIIDIDPGEARTLLKLIEFLMKEWYINRHDAEELMDEISSINEDKQNKRG